MVTLSGMVRSEPAWYVRTASGADFERYATMAREVQTNGIINTVQSTSTVRIRSLPGSTCAGS